MLRFYAHSIRRRRPGMLSSSSSSLIPSSSIKSSSLLTSIRHFSMARIGLPKLAKKPTDHPIHLWKNADGQFESSSSQDPELLIGKKLLAHGNSHYKRIEDMPSWLKERVKEIASMRTRNQKKHHLDIMMSKIPANNYDLHVAYRNRDLGWNPSVIPVNVTPAFVYDASATIVYTLKYMPTRFQVLRRICTELKEIMPSFAPRRVLDFGCGPGTGYAAAFETWGGRDKETGIRKYTGIDASQSMLDMAKLMTNHGDIDRVFWNKSADVFASAKTRGDRFDLIMLTYTLSEMTSDAMRRATTQLAAELLDTNGILVVVEAGDPMGSHVVRTARQFLLDELNIGFRVSQSPSGDTKLRRVNNRSPTDDSAKENASDKTFKFGGNYAIGSTLVKSATVEKNTRNDSSQQFRFQFSLPPPYLLRSSVNSTAENENSRESKHTDASASRDPLLGYYDFGARIIAPCSHDKRCPLGPGVWCSFSQMTRTEWKSINKDIDEKFSYFLLQRTVNPSFMDKKTVHGIDNWLQSDGVLNQLSSKDRTLTPLEVLKRFVDLEKTVIAMNATLVDAEVAGGANRTGPGYDYDKNEDDDDESEDERKVGEEEAEEVDSEWDDSDDDCDEDGRGGSRKVRSSQKPVASSRRSDTSSRKVLTMEDLRNFSEEEIHALPETIRIKKPQHPLLQELIDNLLEEVDWSNYDPMLFRSHWGRVIRTPIKKRGHVIVDVCHPSGQLTRHTLTRANVYPVPAMYSALRKVGWGGVFPAFEHRDEEQVQRNEVSELQSRDVSKQTKKERKGQQVGLVGDNSNESEASIRVRMGLAMVSGLTQEASGRRQERVRIEEKRQKKKDADNKKKGLASGVEPNQRSKQKDESRAQMPSESHLWDDENSDLISSQPEKTGLFTLQSQLATSLKGSKDSAAAMDIESLLSRPRPRVVRLPMRRSRLDPSTTESIEERPHHIDDDSSPIADATKDENGQSSEATVSDEIGTEVPSSGRRGRKRGTLPSRGNRSSITSTSGEPQ